MAGRDDYRDSLRAAARAFFNNIFDLNQFFDAMTSAINRGINRAWREGARECGIGPNELSPEELIEIDNTILNERNRIGDLAQFIQDTQRREDGKISMVFRRIDLWARRYLDTVNRAKIFACADLKLMWLLGVVEEHCNTCPRLDGKVKRASFWKARGIYPQNPPNSKLECGGWGCECETVPTDAPISRGPLPRVP
ncbi:MAG: hypothetical protein ACYTEQ_11755 [Planctomycetota bacterium]|jgi:hypothetical protein